MSRFLSYIHDLRGVAILFVIGVHARGTAIDWKSNQFTHDVVARFFDSQEGNGTALFLFIAGFLFQYLMHSGFDFKKYIRQKFLVIILPYILISIPIILWRIHDHYVPWSVDPSFGQRPKVYQFFYHLFFGSHLSPFWFISAIVMFYLTTPILHKLDKPFFYRYIFPIVFIIGIFTFRAFNNGNPILSYLHYLPIYFCGMWTSYNKEKLLSMDLRYFWIFASLYLLLFILDLNDTFAIAVGITFEQVLAGDAFVFNFYFFRTILMCMMLVFLFYRFQFNRIGFLELLAEYSFGIYFVHFLLIIMVRKIISVMGIVVDFNILTFLMFYAFVIGISVATVYSIKKLTGRYSRNFIGS